jgi:hypothetical protein
MYFENVKKTWVRLDFGEIRVALLFGFLCSFFSFVCLRHVSCVSIVASVSRLSILDCSFGFQCRLFIIVHLR